MNEGFREDMGDSGIPGMTEGQWVALTDQQRKRPGARGFAKCSEYRHAGCVGEFCFADDTMNIVFIERTKEGAAGGETAHGEAIQAHQCTQAVSYCGISVYQQDCGLGHQLQQAHQVASLPKLRRRSACSHRDIHLVVCRRRLPGGFCNDQPLACSSRIFIFTRSASDRAWVFCITWLRWISTVRSLIDRSIATTLLA